MKKSLLSRLVFALAVLLGCIPVSAQSLDEQLQKLSNTAAKEYLNPAVSLFGANLNAGWFNKAPKKKMLGFDLDVSLVAMGSKIEGERTFYKETSFRFDYKQAQELTKDISDPTFRTLAVDAILAKDFTVAIAGGTILGGETDRIRILFGPNGNEEITVNGLLPVKIVVPSQAINLGVGGFFGNIKYIPTAAPQIKIGTVFGTQAVFRVAPSVDLPDSMGKFGYFGFGLEHNVAYWLSALIPVDVSAGFFVQNIKLGDAVKVSAASFGLGVSKTFGFGFLNLTPYANYTMEKTTMDVSYKTTIATSATASTTTSIDFSLEGKSKSKLTTGCGFKMGFFALTAEYNIGKVNSFAGIVSFNF